MNKINMIIVILSVDNNCLPLLSAVTLRG